VNCAQAARQDLIGLRQVMQVGPGVALAGVTAAMLIERRRIVGVLSLLDPDVAPGREEETVATVSRGEDTVEHVHATVDAFQEILRRADSHKITRLVLGQNLVEFLSSRT